MVEHVGVADHQPGQRAGIFFGVAPGVGLYTGIGRGGPVL